MSERTNIVMFGAAGRMGRMILGLAAAAPERYRIVGAVDYAGHAQIGQPLSQLIHGAPAEILLASAPPAEVPPNTVAIDFSTPAATLQNLQWCRQGGHGIIIGTTSLSEEQKQTVETAAQDCPVLLTPNTSRGVNVLFWLVEQATRLLGEDYDVEIVEMHHHHKKDSPSGTARRLAEVVLDARGLDYEQDVMHGREGIVGERKQSEVGMHAVRGGDVVGDHTVYFAGPGERIELIHRAHTRETFAHGALQAARWLAGQQPGNYHMKDALGL